MYKNNLDSIFNLHSQKTLLPHQNFMKKTKESQPNNRCNVYSKGWRNSIPNGSQERLCWPCHYIERCFIQIGGWIPAQNNTTELQKKKSMVRKNVSIPVKCVCGRVCGLDLIVIHLASITTATNTDSKGIEINSPWQTKKG